jgi:hypothetical protein
MIIPMTTTARPQQRYDHRLRDLVQRTGDVTIATDLGVPRSTARGWLDKAPKVVVSRDVTDLRAPELQQEILRLRRRVKKLNALLRLALVLLRSSGSTLTHERLPNGRAKIRILRAVDQARECVPLRAILRFLQLSPSRFHAWRRLELACALDDQSSCPHTSPHRLTPPEVWAIEDMVTAPEYRHVPTGTLAVLAQRLGKVWASPSTWYHLVRKFGWRRPRLRVHPANPKVGLRTWRADEMWHIDTTVIRLLDGTRTYLHAVIDNFSPRAAGERGDGYHARPAALAERGVEVAEREAARGRGLIDARARAVHDHIAGTRRRRRIGRHSEADFAIPVPRFRRELNDPRRFCTGRPRALRLSGHCHGTRAAAAVDGAATLVSGRHQHAHRRCTVGRRREHEFFGAARQSRPPVAEPPGDHRDGASPTRWSRRHR